MPFAPAPRRPHTAVVGGVLALHLLLLLGLLRLGAWGDRSGPSAQAPLLQLRLLPWPAATATAQHDATVEPTRPRAVARGGSVTRALPSPQAITLPTPADGPAAPSTPAPETPAVVATPTPASAPPPLDLQLHRGVAGAGLPSRHPALDDPRANSLPIRAVEDRIAALLGGGDDITEFRLADGSVMLRRGASCVVARPNRSQQLDPFNSNVSPKPRLIDRC